MNRVIFIGNLASDPELRTTQSGIANCTFRLATQRRFKNAQGAYESDFHNIVAWRNTAEFIHKHFIKGNKICIEGTIQNRSYTAQDGAKRYVTEIIAESAEFVTPRSESAQTPPAPSQPGNEQTRMTGFVEYTDDDLPF